MMTFAIVYASKTTRGAEPLRVHLAGCADVERERVSLRGFAWTVEAENADDAVRRVIEEREADGQSFQPRHFKICRCAR